MNVLQQLENSPRNLITYAIGLVGAVVDDYALITLTIASVLLGFTVGSVLIGATAFFGAYFVLRLVVSMVEAISLHAQTQNQTAQATMQIAAALAQFHPPQNQGQSVERPVQRDTMSAT